MIAELDRIPTEAPPVPEVGERSPTVPRHVIVPISAHWDGLRAVPAAVWLASSARAQLHLVAATADAGFTAERRTELDRLAGDLRASGLAADTIVRPTLDVAALVLEEARVHPGAAICMPTRGPGRLGELALGSVAQDVVSRSRGPVVLVGPEVNGFQVPEHLVAAVGADPAAQRVVPLVGAWARAFDLDVELVEVIDTRTEATCSTGAFAGDLLGSATLQAHAATLRDLGLEPSWETLRGEADEAVVDHVGCRPASLLVVGTHGRAGLARLVHGSVAMRIVHHSPVPVVVVR
jgi:nucleotide-binding universal stress UspA family protein